MLETSVWVVKCSLPASAASFPAPDSPTSKKELLFVDHMAECNFSSRRGHCKFKFRPMDLLLSGKLCSFFPPGCRRGNQAAFVPFSLPTTLLPSITHIHTHTQREGETWFNFLPPSTVSTTLLGGRLDRQVGFGPGLLWPHKRRVTLILLPATTRTYPSGTWCGRAASFWAGVQAFWGALRLVLWKSHCSFYRILYLHCLQMAPKGLSVTL